MTSNVVVASTEATSRFCGSNKAVRGHDRFHKIRLAPSRPTGERYAASCHDPDHAAGGGTPSPSSGARPVTDDSAITLPFC